MHVRFRGGRTCSLSLERPKPIARVRKTRPQVIALLDRLLDTCSDRQASEQLNAEGHRNWKGEAFTAKRVRYVRRVYGLKSRYERLREQGYRTGEEIARELGLCLSRVHDLGRDGILQRQRYGNDHRCLYAPLNGAVLVKGCGGRYRPRQPKLIPAQPSTQEVV